MIHRILRLTSLTCCALVALSFGLFALHQVSGASKTQAASVDTPQPSPYGGPPTYVSNAQPTPTQNVGEAQPKRFIDGAWKVLTSPFSSIVESDNQWVLHGIPTLLALLVYGFGIGYVARFTRGMT